MVGPNGAFANDDSVQVVAGYGDRPVERRRGNKRTKSALFDPS